MTGEKTIVVEYDLLRRQRPPAARTHDFQRPGAGTVPAHFSDLDAHRLVRNFLLTTILLTAAAASRGMADDTVTIRSGTAGQRTLSGTIIDFTAQTLTFRASSGRDSSIPANAVIDFATSWSAEKTAADRLFAERDFSQALSGYQTALGKESRGWANRLVQADIVWCLRSLNRADDACNEFFRLLAMDATRQYFAAIPLAWSTPQPSATLERRARSWLDHEEPVVRLMGASWLLSVDRGRSVSTLQQLTSNADSTVAQIAEAQLWRTKITTADDAEVSRWKEQIARMPVALRGGPYFALARVMAYRKQHEQAALGFMRVPTLYPRDNQIVIEAVLAAALELENLGRGSEAASLYRELVNHHETTPQAGQASNRLKALSPENSDE